MNIKLIKIEKEDFMGDGAETVKRKVRIDRTVPTEDCSKKSSLNFLDRFLKELFLL